MDGYTYFRLANQARWITREGTQCAKIFVGNCI